MGSCLSREQAPGPRPVAMARPPSPAVKTALTDEDILFFAHNGYIHLRGVVPVKQVQDALAVIDKAYAEKNHDWNTGNPNDVVPNFRPDVAKHPAVIAALKNTTLWHMVEQLVGANSAWQPQQGQVALRETSKHLQSMGWSENTPLNPDGWHIDGGSGKYAFVGSPFTMLVGICLSHGQDIDLNHGQLLVWPGSHHVLHPGVAERVRENRIKDPHSIFAGTREERPDIGNPMRVLMAPGDAVFAHQRLGHTGGPNLGPYIRKNIYLRVQNKRHDHYLSSGELLNGSVWTEYAGVREVLQRHRLPV